ncbi:MAG: (4Fe-4S)-binding protein [bacterium]|nr:(4Fe-4S)-binding protein [bacterium]
MIIAVAGVKGGAGKTLVATSLAITMGNCRFLDCDVEEPNGHIYLRATRRKRERVAITVPKAKDWLRADLLPAARFCPYHALAVANGSLLVFKELCTGCGGCFMVAPPHSLAAEEHVVGAVWTGDGRGGIEVVTGELVVGSGRAVRVIRAVKGKAKGDRHAVIDCPPGITRPVFEAVRESDRCLLVTEDSPFGLEDLRAGLDGLRLTGARLGVVINRARGPAEGIRTLCAERGVPVLLELPFSREIAEASAGGRPCVDVSPRWADAFSALRERIGADAR